MLTLVLLGLGILIAWGAWLSVLFIFDPFTNGVLIHLLFYCSLGLALFGTAALVGLIVRQRQVNLILPRDLAPALLRQSFLISVFMSMLLYLSAHHLLKWWNIIPLVLCLVTVEYFFSSLEKREKNNRQPQNLKKA